jgi:NAD+ synthase
MNNSFIRLNPRRESEKIIKFIKNTLTEQRMYHVVLGVSGGIDSTTCAYLLNQSLPAENITLAHLYYDQPEFTSLNYLGFKNDHKYNFLLLSIKDMVDEIADQLQIKDREALTDKIRFGNVMARTRMIILYDLAKQLGGLVCGTENKSEHLLGYFTRFGDAASDFEPIRHLYKTQVYDLAKFLGVPDQIINQPASAGLWPNQTDEKQLGFTYAEADEVLDLYFEKKLSVADIKNKGYEKASEVIQYALNNSFKHKTPYVI